MCLSSNSFVPGYWLSLLVCFAGLFLMENAQPALLYIVPGTLIPTAALAAIRGDFGEFWDGDGGTKAEDEDEDEEEERGEAEEAARGEALEQVRKKETDLLF